MICNHVAYQSCTFAEKFKNEGTMDCSERLENLGKRFPNKSIGIGNVDAKILVVTQREGNEEVDFEYLEKLFRDLPDAQGKDLDVLGHCYYVVFDKELLEDSFFEHFQIIQYTFTDGNHLELHNPAQIFGMEWLSKCTVVDGVHRMFVAHTNHQNGQEKRVMFCTYPFDQVTPSIFCCNKLLLNWVLRNAELVF